MPMTGAPSTHSNRPLPKDLMKRSPTVIASRASGRRCLPSGPIRCSRGWIPEGDFAGDRPIFLRPGTLRNRPSPACG